MKKIAYAALTSLAALTLAGCGSSDDASTDAMADNVEVPADGAMTSVEESGATPVADDQATDDADPVDAASAKVEAAGNAAAAAAADVAAAAGEATDAAKSAAK